MFRKIAAFELRYQLTSPVFWVAFGIFFLLSFAAITNSAWIIRHEPRAPVFAPPGFPRWAGRGRWGCSRRFFPAGREDC